MPNTNKVNNLQNSKKEIISFQNAAIIGTIILIGYILLSLIPYNDPNLRTALSDLISPVIGILAVLGLFYAANRSKPYGKRIYSAWLLIAFAQLLYTLGDTLWAFLELFLHVSPFPSPADAFYLLYYIFFAIGILLLLRSLETPEKVYKTILDIAIVIISASLIFWNTLLSFVILTQNEASMAFSLSFYYIIRDFVIFALLLNLTLRTVDKWARNPLILLIGAIGVQIITDAIFSYQFLNGTYLPGSLTDVGWVVSYLLIGLAGILQGNTAGIKLSEKTFEMQKPRTFIIFSFPMIWISLAVFMLVWGYYNLSPANFFIIKIKVVIFFILLIIRRAISVNEKWHVYLKFRRN